MMLQSVLERTTSVLRVVSPMENPLPNEVVALNAGVRLEGGVVSEEDRTLSMKAIDLLIELEYMYRPWPDSVSVTTEGRRAMARNPQSPVQESDQSVRVWWKQEEFNLALSKGLWKTHNTFTRLHLRNWRQFREVDIIFHDRLTVLTGVNAAGKTTLLNLLSPHFNWDSQVLSVGDGESSDERAPIGRLHYSNGNTAIVIEADTSQGGVSTDAPMLINRQQVAGIYISSHRAISGYRALENLPTRFSAANVLLDQFASEVHSRYAGDYSQYPPLYRMKEGLVSAALYGYGNEAVTANGEAKNVWLGFQAVLKAAMPEDLEFERLQVADGELYLDCKSGRFPIEAASGGLSAILELCWQIFLRSRDEDVFTVIIDEPENHLHPELQRSLVPALLRAFPNVRFILATHSPFVVTADADASVYALARDAEGQVSTNRLDKVNAGATPDETLTKVLGLQTPLALWAQEDFAAALQVVPTRPTADDLSELRQRLKDIGLADQFPAAINALMQDDSSQEGSKK